MRERGTTDRVLASASIPGESPSLSLPLQQMLLDQQMNPLHIESRFLSNCSFHASFWVHIQVLQKEFLRSQQPFGSFECKPSWGLISRGQVWRAGMPDVGAQTPCSGKSSRPIRSLPVLGRCSRGRVSGENISLSPPSRWCLLHLSWGGPFTPLLWSSCSASFQVLLRGHYSTCSFSCSVSMGEREFRLFPSCHPGPPPARDFSRCFAGSTSCNPHNSPIPQ